MPIPKKTEPQPEPPQEITFEDIEPLLKKAGFTQESINGFLDMYMRVKYEPETIEALKPEFFFDSDNEVMLGNKKKKLRELNGYDIARITTKIKSVFLYMFGEDPAKSEKIKTMNPTQFAGHVFTQAYQEHLSGKRTPLVYTMFEEISFLLSDPENAKDGNGKRENEQYSPNFIACLPLSQLKTLILTLFEVNKKPFLELWALLPNAIHQAADFQIGKITKIIESFGQEKKTEENPQPPQSLNGGSDPTGELTTGSLSESTSE